MFKKCLPHLAFTLMLGFLASLANAQQDPVNRVSKGGLKEEQRIIAVHLREARKDLDRAKVDLNGNRNRTAEVVIARTEISISKAGGLLEEHPIRIERLKGLFVGETDREELREEFDKLDNTYLNLEREFYTMVDEIGGGATRRSRMEFLKLISSAIPALQESNPSLAKQFEALMSEYEGCLKAGDKECARAKLEELLALYESKKSEIAAETGKQVSTDNVISTEPSDWPAIISQLESGKQSEAQGLLSGVQSIADPDKRLEAEKLYGDYLHALQNGNTAKAAELKGKIEALTGVPISAPAPPTVVESKKTPRVEHKGGMITFIDAKGRPIYSAEANKITTGMNTIPQAEYAGEIGKRITKEFDILLNYDATSQSFTANQENLKIWSLEVTEDPSQRILDTTLITVFELHDGGSVGDDYAVESWVMQDDQGNTIREGSGQTFKVEFAEPGTYRILARGRTLRDNNFEIGREYPIAEGILE